MAVPFVKVYYTPPGGAEQDITEYANLQHKRGLQIKDAKVDITINNSRNRYKSGGESIFVEDGTIDVYADYAPITKTNAQLVLSGQIQEISHTYGERGGQTKLSVSDKTTLLLSGIWGKTYSNMTVDDIIVSVIEQAPSAEGQVTTNNVATSTADGSAFPTIDMAKVMKPVYEWLTDLSQPEITGEDKAYLFFVDKDNDLHWFYPSGTAVAAITEGSTTEIYSVSMRKSQDALVNMVIYNAGQDMRGNGILWYKYNATSKSNKLRMKFNPMTDIGRDLFESEIKAGKLTESTGGDFHYQGKDYVATGGYPITPSWQGAVAVDDEDDYNDAFRTRCKVIADGRAQAFMQAFAGLRWKGKLEIKGTNSHTAGDLITITLPSIGIISEKLRVWDVQQSFGTDGWITGLELREDDEPISSA